jgi:hypothetical protein
MPPPKNLSKGSVTWKPTTIAILVLIGCMVLFAIVVVVLQLIRTEKEARIMERLQDMKHILGSSPRIGIVCMMRDAKDVDHWLNHHLGKGVSRFYVRLEIPQDRAHNDSPLAKRLLSYPQVLLKIGNPDETPAASDIEEPGQRQMLRQRAWVTEAIKHALREGINWLVHIDCDELVECDGTIGDAILTDARPDTQTMVMRNVEAVYGQDRLTGKETCFDSKGFKNCDAGLCAAYANGKSVGRVSEHLREFGAHRFRYEGPGKDDEVLMQSMHVLHFESCNFRQYVDKFMRLSASESRSFPFPYYNESIEVARGEKCKQRPPTEACETEMARVYRKYRIQEES